MTAEQLAYLIQEYGSLILVLGVVFLILNLFLLFLWILLPFAVFGIKKRLNTVIGELEVLNDRMGSLVNRVLSE